MSSISAGIGGNRRRTTDVFNLLRKGFELEMEQNNTTEFTVKFRGPEDSPYAGGLWRVSVVLPAGYPIKSPSIAFKDKIYHPNIEWNSGAVCLDVLNQVWTPVYDLHNVFDAFLPQLLSYPNCSDPLNGVAAGEMLRDQEGYERKVKTLVRKYAQNSTRERPKDTEAEIEDADYSCTDSDENNCNEAMDDDDDDDSSIASISD